MAGAEVWLSTFLTLALNGDGWRASRFADFPHYPLYRRLCEPRAGLDAIENRLLLPEIEPIFLGCLVLSIIAISTHQ
jgi:hypothetical protein